jgi:hypothetical protein
MVSKAYWLGTMLVCATVSTGALVSPARAQSATTIVTRTRT